MFFEVFWHNEASSASFIGLIKISVSWVSGFGNLFPIIMNVYEINVQQSPGIVAFDMPITFPFNAEGQKVEVL